MKFPSRGRKSLHLAATLTAIVASAVLLSSCTSTTAAAPAAAKVSAADQASQLAKILGITADDKNGSGLTWDLGAAFPLSGGGATDGKELTNAVELAVKQIKDAGGPDIKITYADNKSGDPAASKQAMRDLIAAGVPAKLSSYADGLGAMLQDTATSKMLSLDGVGGAPIYAEKVPYFYGTRAAPPMDALPGALKYWAKAHPDKKNVGLVGWDLGPFNDQVKAQISKMAVDAGLNFNGLWEMVPATTQDFSQSIAKIKANQPDLLIMGMANQAPAAFTVQAKAAGLTATPLGIEFTTTGVNASKGTWDSDGFIFTMDYFDAANPQNPLAELFVDSYTAKYGAVPGFYGANAYEDTLAFWQIIRGVLKDGGDPDDSTQLLKALEANPAFPSVYGGTSSEPGSLGLNLDTHGIAKRPMGVYQYKAGKVTTMATFNVNGEDLTLSK
jgi:branched-chain amino acid transport system substrate-binding protein